MIGGIRLYLQKAKNLLIGYVNIIVEGYYIEKFINTCKKNDIFLLDMKRKNSTLINANVPAKDFKIVANLAKKNKCKIKIKKKMGVPFILHKYRKRKFFVISLIGMLVALIVLSKFIWNIEITGNNNIETSEIMEIIKEEGLEVGKLKNKINPKDIVETIRLKRPDVSWVGIRISGTNVNIEIVEADVAPHIIKGDEYCDIVANSDALVEKISSQNGTILVNEVKMNKINAPTTAGGSTYGNGANGQILKSNGTNVY